MKILLATITIFCGLFGAVESAFAQTWTETSAPTNLNWSSIISSADGTKLVALVNGGTSTIYTSTNSGTTWISNNVPYEAWQAVASSADGNKLIAVTHDGPIYTSTDSGATWISNNAPNEQWGSVASSADGNKLLVAGLNVWTSTNAGMTWISNNVPHESWQAVASSADGNKLIAATHDGPIYTSPDSGATWISNNAPNELWGSVASSADGKILTVVSQGLGEDIFTSTNFGNTWMPDNAPNLLWTSVASSADGAKLVAIAYNRVAGGAVAPIYISTDAGDTWVSNSAPFGTRLNFGYVASSADGSKLVAAVSGVGIYTLYSTPTSQLNLAPTNNNFLLFWIIPSTNFVLQKNSGLAITDWVALTNVPTLNLTNLNYEVTLPQTNSSSFFRLMAQ